MPISIGQSTGSNNGEVGAAAATPLGGSGWALPLLHSPVPRFGPFPFVFDIASTVWENLSQCK